MKRLLFLVVGLIAYCTTFADNVIYYAKRDNVRVLQSYDKSSATLGYLSKGTPIKVIGSTFAYNGLYEVEIKRVRGYMLISDMSDEYIEQTNNAEIIISSKPTYYALRETRLLQSYDRASATIAKIQTNETLQIIGSTFAYKGLYEAVYQGKKGYVLAKDVAYLDKRKSEEPKPVQNPTQQPESNPVVNEQVIEEETIASESIDQTESTDSMPVVTEDNQLSEEEIVPSQTETMPWFNLDAKDMRYLTIIVILLVVLLHYMRKVKKDNDINY